MQKPICTEPIAAFAFTILEQDQPVPVSLAGYRLREGRQYYLRVQSTNPSVKIQDVTLESDDSVEDHGGSTRESAIYLRRFKVIDNSWWRFLPFRFLANTVMLRVEIDIIGGGSRKIYVPIIIVHFVPAFSNLYWVWSACGLTILFGWPYLLYLVGVTISTMWMQIGLFVGFLLIAPIIAVVWQFRILKRKAKEVRTLFLSDSDEEERLELDSVTQ